MEAATTTIEQATTATITSVPPDMTIYAAQERKYELLTALAETEHLMLDLSHVAEIDTTGLQLLILAKREAAAAGKRVVFTGHSAAVREAIDFCNLAANFDDPMVIPA